MSTTKEIKFYAETALPAVLDSSMDGVYFIANPGGNKYESFDFYLVANGVSIDLNAIKQAVLDQVENELQAEILLRSLAADVYTKLQTYSQTEVDIIVDNAVLRATTDFKGTVVPTSPALATDGFVIAAQAGTYVNLGGIIVPENSLAVISRVGGVYKASITTIQQAENRIPDWEAGTHYGGAKPDQRNWKGQMWSVNVPSTTQEPGTGTDWIGKIDKISTADLGFNENGKETIDIYDKNNVQSGSWAIQLSTGKVVKLPSLNWISYMVLTNLEVDDEIMVKNYIISAAAFMCFQTGADNIPILSILPQKSSFKVVKGASKVYLNLAAVVGIGERPTENTLDISIYKSGKKKLVSKILGDGIEATSLSKSIEFNGAVVNPRSPATKEYVDSRKTDDPVSFLKEGFPSSDLGKNGDGYTDVTTGRMYIKNAGSWGTGFFPYGKDTSFIYPEDFTWRPISLIKQANGFYIPSVQDVEVFAKADMESLVPYYVGLNGSASNDGLTRDTPLPSVQAAISVGARYIRLLEGVYGRTIQLPDYVDSNTEKPFILIADRDNTVTFTSGDRATDYVWTKDVNVYSTVRSVVVNVLDFTVSDEFGMIGNYEQKTTVEEVKATSGSWCLIGTTVTINTLDGLPPTGKIHLCLNTSPVRYMAGENVPYVYMRGINFYSVQASAALLIRNSQSVQHSTKVYVKNCDFGKNSLGNGLAIDNIKEAWVQNCRSALQRRDSFNYHTSLLYTMPYEAMKVVEIKCWSRATGRDYPTESSSNASTMHEGGTIIRIGSDFADARGPVVADVNNGIRSLNFNVKAFKSILAGSAAFYVNGKNSKVWLYGCEAGDCPNSVIASGVDCFAYYDSETILDGPTSANVIAL